MSETPGRILEDIRRDFDEEKRSGFANFDVSRGLFRNIELGTDGYLDSLPTFEGSDLVELIDAEIHKRKVESQTTGKPYQRVRIVDIGYGQGRMLLDCASKWGEDVELIGYGNSNYSKISVMSEDGSMLPPTKDEIDLAGIRLIEGNIIDIRKTLGDNFADFLVCCNTMQWVSYPQWEMVKKIYRTLNVNGVALIDSIYLGQNNQQRSNLSIYLENNGYSFELGKDTIAFKKTQLDIALPIRSIESIFDQKVVIPNDPS